MAHVNRDRGTPCGATPPTPPDTRVRIRRFGGLRIDQTRHRHQAEIVQPRFGESAGERPRDAQSPRAFGTGCHRATPGFRDSTTIEFGSAPPPRLPLDPRDAADASANPAVKRLQFRQLAETEVARPPAQVTREVTDQVLQTDAPMAPRNEPHALAKARALWGRYTAVGRTRASARSPGTSGPTGSHRTLRGIHLQ